MFESTVVVNETKNLTAANVTRPKVGVYCFHGLPFTPKNIQVTLGFTGGTTAFAQAPGVGSDCTETGNQAEVEIVNGVPKAIDAGFMVLFN